MSLARLVRTAGHASAPLSLQVLIFPPGLELAVAAVAFGYTFAALLVAVQAAVATTPGRALISVLAGFTLFAVVLSVLGSGTRDLAPGVFPLNPLPISVGIRTTAR